MLRYCEFGQACIERAWSPDSRDVLYIGFVAQHQKERSMKTFRDYVYKKWDDMPGAPPKSRPEEDGTAGPATPELQLLAWQHGKPVWPQPLSSRFSPDTDEHATIMKMKAEFEKDFPQSTVSVGAAAVVGGRRRAGGACDFSVDGGKAPLDTERVLSLPAVGHQDFEGELNARLLGWFVCV